MNYIKKLPSADKELSNKFLSEGWKKLNEPSNLGMAILLSVPFMFINGVISMAIAYYLYPPLKEHINSGTFSLTINFLTLLILITIMTSPSSTYKTTETGGDRGTVLLSHFCPGVIPGATTT
jgi:hypothetical protein